MLYRPKALQGSAIVNRVEQQAISGVGGHNADLENEISDFEDQTGTLARWDRDNVLGRVGRPGKSPDAWVMENEYDARVDRSGRDVNGENSYSSYGKTETRAGAQTRLSVGAIMRSRTAQGASFDKGGLDGHEQGRNAVHSDTAAPRGSMPGINMARPATEGNPAPLSGTLSLPRALQQTSPTVRSDIAHLPSSSEMEWDTDREFVKESATPVSRLQRPHSRKLYLGSAKQQDATAVSTDNKIDQNETADKSVLIQRPTSRKLYLGTDNSSPSSKASTSITTDEMDFTTLVSTKSVSLDKMGKDTDKSHRQSKKQDKIYTERSSHGMSHDPVNRIEPGGAVWHDDDSVEVDGSSDAIRALALQEPEIRPPSRQSSAFPVRLDSADHEDNDVHDAEAYVKEWDDGLNNDQIIQKSKNKEKGPSNDASLSRQIKPTHDKNLDGKREHTPVDLNELSSDDEIFTKRADRGFGKKDKPDDVVHDDSNADSNMSRNSTNNKSKLLGSPQRASNQMQNALNAISSPILGRSHKKIVTAVLGQVAQPQHASGSSQQSQDQQIHNVTVVSDFGSSVNRDVTVTSRSSKGAESSSSRYTADSRPIGGNGSPNNSIFRILGTDFGSRVVHSSTGVERSTDRPQLTGTNTNKATNRHIATAMNNDFGNASLSNNNKYSRADLPTRGVCDPISDGFALLGDDDGRWPFPIQVNYNNNSTSKSRKGSKSTSSPGGATQMEVPEAIITTNSSVAGMSGRVHETQNSASIEDTRIDHVTYEKLRKTEEKLVGKVHSTQTETWATHMSPKPNPEDDFNLRSNRELVPTAPTTAPTMPGARGVQRGLHIHRSSGNAMGNRTVSATTIPTFTAQTLTAARKSDSIATSSDRVHDRSDKHQGNVYTNDIGSEHRGTVRPERMWRPDVNQQDWSVDTYGYSDREEEDFGEDPDDDDEYDKGDSGFGDSSREVNGIFNIQAELLDSNLGEDFLSLFAKHAPPRPAARATSTRR